MEAIAKEAWKYLNITTVQSLKFKDTFDVYATPKVFILDKDKKIIAKQLPMEYVKEFIEKDQKRNAE